MALQRRVLKATGWTLIGFVAAAAAQPVPEVHMTANRLADDSESLTRVLREVLAETNRYAATYPQLGRRTSAGPSTPSCEPLPFRAILGSDACIRTQSDGTFVWFTQHPDSPTIRPILRLILHFPDGTRSEPWALLAPSEFPRPERERIHQAVVSWAEPAP